MEKHGVQHVFLGNYEKAESFLDSSNAIFIKYDSLVYVDRNLINYSLIYDIKRDYDKGFSSYIEYYEKMKMRNELNGMSLANNSISVMYFYIGDYEKSIDYGMCASRDWQEDQYLDGRADAVKNIAVCW